MEAIVTKFTDMTLDMLGTHAAGHIKAADRELKRAEDHYRSAGLYLIEARKRIQEENKKAGRKVINFTDWLKEYGISSSRAYEYISIADGTSTLAEIRAEKAATMRASRERKIPQRCGKNRKATKSAKKKDKEPDDPSWKSERERLLEDIMKVLSNWPERRLKKLLEEITNGKAQSEIG